MRTCSSLVVLFALVACTGSPPGVNPGTPEAGSAGGTCLQGDVCDEGLTCLANLCETIADAGTGDGGPDDAGSDAGTDAGTLDGGTDAGALDAGTDAGALDAGADAGALDGGDAGSGGDAGGVSDAGGGADAGPPSPCATSQTCTGGARCQLVVVDGGLAGRCLPRAGDGQPGDLCDAGPQCGEALCVGGACSALCEDRSACGVDQRCAPHAITVDDTTATVDVCETLPDLSCTSQTTCAPDRVCADLDFDGVPPLVTSCIFPNDTGKALGEACSTTGNSLECRDRVCLEGFSGGCSRLCEVDGDCAPATVDAGSADAGPSGDRVICSDVDFRFNGAARLCVDGCAVAADCPSTQRCTLNPDSADDLWEWVCRKPTASLPKLPGESCFVDGGPDGDGGTLRFFGCSTEFCAGSLCTTPCAVAGDCPSPFTTCGDVPTTKPGGDGGTTVKVCKP